LPHAGQVQLGGAIICQPRSTQGQTT
jgi:hypothetical protein